jgi:hypothetical protein
LFLEKYLDIMKAEKEYFELKFGNIDKFNNIRREHEYDMLNKYLRPRSIACNAFPQICSAIDFLRLPEISQKLEKECL